MNDTYQPASPHDAVFKHALSNIEKARDFMAIYLPENVRDICDLSTLRPEPSSVIEPQLRPYFADVIYSMKTHTGDDAYVQVIIEHQSSPHPHMAFRLIKYALAIMQYHLDKTGAKKKSKLPLVVPLLYYHGRTPPGKHATDWFYEFADPVLAKEIYTKPFPLVDVPSIPDEVILGHKKMALLTLLHKHIFDKDLMGILDSVIQICLQENITQEDLRVMLKYMIEAGNTQNVPLFIDQLAHQMPKYGDTLMTIAEKLRKEGEERKMQQSEAVLEKLLQDFDLDDGARTKFMETYKQKLNHPHDD